MVFILGKLGWAIVQPGNLLLLCLVGGILLGSRRHDKAARALILFAAFGLLLLAVAPVGPALLLPLEQRFPRPALPAKLDGILVLGGVVDPRLSQAYGMTALGGAVQRLLAAIELARQHPEAKLALLGGEGSLLPIGYAESRATLGFVTKEGIARDRIVLEERSRTTRENAVLGKQLVQPQPGQSWVLVTSAYHMPRAVGSFRAAGWRVIPDPVDYRIDPRHWLRPDFNLLDGLRDATIGAKEWIGLTAYWWLGWTKAWFPAPLPAATVAAHKP